MKEQGFFKTAWKHPGASSSQSPTADSEELQELLKQPLETGEDE
ncbi:hypothetical protein [Paenibacillus puerhi]|nr:hypothetical protein [Paenibacillus puerhi]